jgi:hypothetical protein
VASVFANGEWSAPVIIGTSSYSLTSVSVSCPGVANCVATDSLLREFTYSASGWGSPVQLEKSNTPYGNGLVVSCASASGCVALDLLGHTFQFDGRRWSGPHTSLPKDATGELYCSQPSFCIAGGGPPDDVFLGT